MGDANTSKFTSSFILDPKFRLLERVSDLLRFEHDSNVRHRTEALFSD